MYSHCRLLSLILSSIVLFQHVSAIASGKLGIQINDGVATGPTKRLVLGSIATIRGLSGWSQEQIVDLAFVAHDDMRAAHAAANVPQKYPGLGKKPPGVTTVLVIEDTAYISSSMTGGPYLYVPNGATSGSRFTTLDAAHPCNGPVEDALSRCQTNSINLSGHRTGASCGEPMAALAYCSTHNQRNFADAKIVTITGRTTETYKIVPPCGDPNGKLEYEGEWGCHGFTSETGLGITVIPDGTSRQSTDVSDDDIAISYATYP